MTEEHVVEHDVPLLVLKPADDSMSEDVSIRQRPSAYVSKRHLRVVEASRGLDEKLPDTTPQEDVTLVLHRESIRQHTSYISILQHTSAYVSIRRHTSAYVSTRSCRKRHHKRMPLLYYSDRFGKYRVTQIRHQ
jgi:hypothetical protein